jgi:hypothetical protein
MQDLTVHRCRGRADNCGRVARWRDGDEWTCKDHARASAVYVMPPPPPPPPVHDYEVIGTASIRIRQRR